MSDLVSVIIPARGEKYLAKTIDDLFQHAQNEIEVIAVLDSFWPNPPLADRKNLVVVHNGGPLGMRMSVNRGAAIARGSYLMKCDAHCSFAQGFDEALVSDCAEDMVVIPRRERLDVVNWKKEENDREPVDYQYFMVPWKFNPPALHGFRWDERTIARKNILIDDVLTFQGSCWLMHKSHFQRHGFLQVEGYNGLPQQEAEEIVRKTIFSGGRVVVNKGTQYLHWHKTSLSGHGYPTSKTDIAACYDYSYTKFVLEQREKFVSLIERYMPIPGWPVDFESRLFKGL